MPGNSLSDGLLGRCMGFFELVDTGNAHLNQNTVVFHKSLRILGKSEIVVFKVLIFPAGGQCQIVGAAILNVQIVDR